MFGRLHIARVQDELVMTSRSQPKDFDAAFAELDGENDRAVILVGASILEYALERAIASRLREPETQADLDVMFAERGFLGTLNEKIWAAYFLKIIGPSTRRDLDLVRRIRNIAAHDMNLCVPRTSFVLISRENCLTSVHYDRAAMFRTGRPGRAIQVEEPA